MLRTAFFAAPLLVAAAAVATQQKTTMPAPEQAAPRHVVATRNVSIPSHQSASVLGRSVKGADGAAMGRIVNVLVDPSGHPRAAVIDFGGFMGVGSRKIAVAWNALHFPPGDTDAPVLLSMTADQIKKTPEYKGTAQPVTIVAPANPGSSAISQPVLAGH